MVELEDEAHYVVVHQVLVQIHLVVVHQLALHFIATVQVGPTLHRVSSILRHQYLHLCCSDSSSSPSSTPESLRVGL